MEQNEIANRIKGINEIIKREQRYLIKQQKIKQALMSDLLTGKVPVKYEEEKAEVI